MSYSFVLVHSPLVGPYSWQPVRDELESMGQRTVIPSLLPVLNQASGFADSMAHYVREAVKDSALPDPLVLVGHSAAGAYLPVIRSHLEREVSAYLFVDARLPKSGASLADQDSREAEQRRREMAEGGMLPPWSEWFSDRVLENLLPNEESRLRFVDELSPIPLALFHEEIAFASEWTDAPCAYLRLSEYYKPLFRDAMAEGWHVSEINAEHLHLITHPLVVTKLLLDVLDQMEVA